MRYWRIVLIGVLLVFMMGCVGKFKGYRHTEQTPAELLAGDPEDETYPELKQVGSPKAGTDPQTPSSTQSPSAAAVVTPTPARAPTVDSRIDDGVPEELDTMSSTEPHSAPPAQPGDATRTTTGRSAPPVQVATPPSAMNTPADIMRAAIPFQPTQYRTILVVGHKNKFGDWVESHHCHILFRQAMFKERQIPELPPLAPVIKRESKQQTPINPFSGYHRQSQSSQPTPGAAAGSNVPINLADYLRQMGVVGAPHVRPQPHPR